MPTPIDIYRRKLEFLSRTCERLAKWDVRIANGRLIVAISALVLAWPVLLLRIWSWQWLLIPLTAFAALATWHAHLLLRMKICRRAIRYYDRGQQRLQHSWQGGETDGSALSDDVHLYSADLDLFGPASLFDLLCTARTLPGQHTLARWLKVPASISDIKSRHGALNELSQRLDLREDLATLGEDLTPQIHRRELVAWSREPLQNLPSFLSPLAALLAGINVLAFSFWILSDVESLWVIGAIGLSTGFTALTRSRVKAELDLGTKPVEELRLLAEFLHRLESDDFQDPLLRKLQNRSSEPRDRPSYRIAHLARLIDWNASRRNQMFLPFASLLLLGTQLAVRVQRWRTENSEKVDQWLTSLGEFEALNCLANFAFENPDYVYPSLREDGPHFAARELSHPLLPRDRRVGNDVELSEKGRWLLVSGSNMSGKSTLLRSVGINAVLAFAGAPVCAQSLSLSPLALGASIRVHDSLEEGVSRFYAEIQRLKAIRDLAAKEPLLFLLDEILHGTNSHDRRVGAEGVLRDLVSSGGIGLVTTHDLALTEISDQLTPPGVNVHFEDHLEDDRIAFDYTLRPGPVAQGNALALMRSLGLEV